MIYPTFLQTQDWPDLARYRHENAILGAAVPGEKRVVFMGDSITEDWSKLAPGFFAGKPYINRGIGGQTTPQMLIRFRQDVIALEPNVVVLLAGTNDIAGNTGPSTLEMIEDNITSMAVLAKAQNIKVVLSSVLPVYDYPWAPGLQPTEKIPALNTWLENYALENNCVYLDYYSSMTDDRKGMKPEYSPDGVHPNEAGYKVMGEIAQETIAVALAE
jgi:lysophospholipase L1-like esterase